MRIARGAAPVPMLERSEVRRIVVLALVGTLAVAAAVLMLNWRIDHDIVTVIDPADQGPTHILRQDFPGYQLHHGPGHDGQSFYAIAREPMHFHDLSPWVDRPQYRLQRIAMPVLAWALHPQGGGRGLVVALWFWAAVGVALTGIGAALLARGLGASADIAGRLALLVPLLPAAWATLDLTVADELALGFALVAMALDLFGRRRSALALAVLAVLTKEVVLLILLGWVIWRGRDAIVRMFVIPTAVVAGWWIFVHLTVSGARDHNDEFKPITGVIDAIREYATGNGRLGALTAVVAIALGIAVLVKRGIRSPLAAAIVLQFALLLTLSKNPYFGDWNTSRSVGPLLLLAIIALTVPRRAAPPPEPATRESAVSSLPAARA